jgi:capsule polysaccharide export protein KpsE/RkpR
MSKKAEEIGIEASKVLKSPAFRYAIDIVRSKIVTSWASSSIFNTRARKEKLHVKMTLVEEVEKELQAAARQYEKARAEQERKANRQKFDSY